MPHDVGKRECVNRLKEIGVGYAIPLSSTGYAVPDVFFEELGHRHVLEVKRRKELSTIYITHSQIEGLMECAEAMAARPYIAVKVVGTGVFKLTGPMQLRKTETGNYAVDGELIDAGPTLLDYVSYLRTLEASR